MLPSIRRDRGERKLSIPARSAASRTDTGLAMSAGIAGLSAKRVALCWGSVRVRGFRVGGGQRHIGALLRRPRQASRAARAAAKCVGFALTTTDGLPVARPELRIATADSSINTRRLLAGHRLPVLQAGLCQMLGRRSKYSSSSFFPPSPWPNCFSDCMNSMRSIHLPIL